MFLLNKTLDLTKDIETLKRHIRRLETLPTEKPGVYAIIRHSVVVDLKREVEALIILEKLESAEKINYRELATIILVPGFSDYRLLGERANNTLMTLKAEDKRLLSDSKRENKESDLLNIYVLYERQERKKIYLDSLRTQLEQLEGKGQPKSYQKRSGRDALAAKIYEGKKEIVRYDKRVRVLEAILRNEEITLDERDLLSSIKGFYHYEAYENIQYLEDDFAEFTFCAVQ